MVVSERVKELLRSALQLTLEERANLAFELIASIDVELAEDAKRAWAAEIERRASPVIAGESTGADWETVRARILSALTSR